MTRCFARDDNNDLFITGGSLSIVTGIEAVLQICEHAAKAILGEMVFEQQKGMPYFETVWVGNPSTAAFEAAFRTRIAEIDGVTGIEELTTGQSGDSMQYSATIVTVYGTGTING